MSGCLTMSNRRLFALALVAPLSFVAQRGIAEDASSLHQGQWPIQNGFNHQPTQNELGAVHDQDVTSDQAREIDRLYDQLLSSGLKTAADHPRFKRSR